MAEKVSCALYNVLDHLERERVGVDLYASNRPSHRP